MSSSKKYVWLDVDPGHDDAIAILMALHCPNIQLLGVSSTHGNADHKYTSLNVARCLYAFGANESIKAYPGAAKPLLREAKHDPEIHGEDGLGGVEGLPELDDPNVLSRFARDEHEKSIRALDGMSSSISGVMQAGRGDKVTVISCGPMTNIALFVTVYPDLLDAVEEFVFMGGAVGMGNRSAVAEYNIMCDPHAAQIVLDSSVRTVMVPINVTHTAIVTQNIQRQLLSPGSAGDSLPQAQSNLRHSLFTLINFFAESYKSTFGFNDGPPLHDALTVAYVSNPDLFKGKRYRVDVELEGKHCVGTTVVDIWNYRECDSSWGSSGKNCFVTEKLNVPAFFDMFLGCVLECDALSPLNK